MNAAGDLSSWQIQPASTQLTAAWHMAAQSYTFQWMAFHPRHLWVEATGSPSHDPDSEGKKINRFYSMGRKLVVICCD
jgi:hypothetical protein